MFVDFHSFWFLWFLQCTPYLSGASWNLKHLLHNYARKKTSQQKNCRDKMMLYKYLVYYTTLLPREKSLFVLAIIHAWNKNFISCSCHVIWIIVIHCKSVNCFSFAFEPLCANSDYCKIRETACPTIVIVVCNGFLSAQNSQNKSGEENEFKWSTYYISMNLFLSEVNMYVCMRRS